jgi:hypothetical protein
LSELPAARSGAAALDRALARVLPSWDRPIPPQARVEAPVPGPRSGPHRFSVVIPCFNYARFLPHSVGSALDQQGVEVEVVVVDDASSDATAEVAAAMAEEDPRVRVVSHLENAGHVVSFNDGFAVATGDFIVRLDADDLLTPGSLERAAAVFDAFPDVGLVYGNPHHFVDHHPPEPSTQVQGWTVWSGTAWLAERCRLGVNCITTPEAVVRGDVMRRIGPLDTRLRFAQDMEMWLRTAAVSDVARVDGADQALHRDHDASMSVTVGSGVLTDLEERRRVFEVLFDGPGGDLPEAAALRETAMRTLAAEGLDRACRAYDRGQVGEVPVDDFIDFATETFPDFAELTEWTALRRRQKVGPRWSPYVPTFFARSLTRRADEELRYARWSRTGV